MNSNRNNRPKFEQKINLQFTERDWESFVNYRKQIRRRRKLLIYLFAGLVVASVSLSLYLSSRQSRSDLHQKDPSNIETPELNLAITPKKEPVDLPKDETFFPGKKVNYQNTNKSNTSDEKRITANSKISAGQVESNYEVLPETYVKESGDPVNFRPQITYGNNDAIIEKSMDQEDENGVDLNMVVTPLIHMMGRNKRIELPNKLHRLNLSPIESIQFSPDSWQKNEISGIIYGGTALFLHNLTLDEQAHQVGLTGYYSVGRELRVKTGFELSAVDYVATEMNPRIGVDFMESPIEHAIFQEAIVESLGVSIDLGIDYRIWKKRDWSMFTGISYRIAREFRKGIEYEFKEDSIDPMEIFVKSERAERYFEPLILKLETGITYETKAGGINFLLSRSIPLSKHRTAQLNQWQLNLGISHHF